MQQFIPFAAPDIGEDEIAEVVDTLRSGWITTGPKAKRFEESFGEFLGGGLECVALNSATAGLHLALEAIGTAPGDEVIVPSYTFTATAEVVRYFGADPVFVDVDPRTYCICPAAVEAAITSRTRAILPVHFAGLAADMDRLLAIAKSRAVHVIEDAAHAFPARYRGQLVGSLASTASVFSFYANKTLATGEGGMLVTRDQTIADRARIMRLHGIDRDAFDRFNSRRPAWFYQIVAPGFKYNLTDIAASLGIHQLRRASEFERRRTYLAKRYNAALADLPVVLPPQAVDGGTHAWHLYVLLLSDEAGISRDAVIDAMHANGVGCSVHYIPLHQQPYWRDRYELTADRFPHSEELARRAFSVPLYTRMTDLDQDRVIASLREILRRR